MPNWKKFPLLSSMQKHNALTANKLKYTARKRYHYNKHVALSLNHNNFAIISHSVTPVAPLSVNNAFNR